MRAPAPGAASTPGPAERREAGSAVRAPEGDPEDGRLDTGVVGDGDEDIEGRVEVVSGDIPE